MGSANTSSGTAGRFDHDWGLCWSGNGQERAEKGTGEASINVREFPCNAVLLLPLFKSFEQLRRST